MMQFQWRAKHFSIKMNGFCIFSLFKGTTNADIRRFFLHFVASSLIQRAMSMNEVRRQQLP